MNGILLITFLAAGLSQRDVRPGSASVPMRFRR